LLHVHFVGLTLFDNGLIRRRRPVGCPLNVAVDVLDVGADFLDHQIRDNRDGRCEQRVLDDVLALFLTNEAMRFFTMRSSNSLVNADGDICSA
jgi:hypothetical protein